MSYCSACPTGRYQSYTGSTSCSVCGSGRYNPYTGQTSSTSCYSCPSGKYSSSGSSSCTWIDSSSMPTKKPVTLPPVPEPTKLPVPAPTKVPIPAPTTLPITAPTTLSIPAPTTLSIPAPTERSLPAPTLLLQFTPQPTPELTTESTLGTAVPLPSPTQPIPAPTTLSIYPLPTPAPTKQPFPTTIDTSSNYSSRNSSMSSRNSRKAHPAILNFFFFIGGMILTALCLGMYYLYKWKQDENVTSKDIVLNAIQISEDPSISASGAGDLALEEIELGNCRIINVAARPIDALCIICHVAFAPAHMVPNGSRSCETELEPCQNKVCIGCATSTLLSAYGDRENAEKINQKGVRAYCCNSGVFTNKGILKVEKLGKNFLPDSRCESGHPPQPVMPLKQSEAQALLLQICAAKIPKRNRYRCDCGTILDIPRSQNQRPERRPFVCPSCGARVCQGCHNPWHGRLSKGVENCQKFHQLQAQGAASDLFIQATTKTCPGCNAPISHSHGHACHHIMPGTGCPNCGLHWCYSCKSTAAQNVSTRCLRNPERCPTGGCRDEQDPCQGRCACLDHSWSTFCSRADDENTGETVQQRVFRSTEFMKGGTLLDRYPKDPLCGCTICSDCRCGAPCKSCDGSCVVCIGLLPPGPGELNHDSIDEWRRALHTGILATLPS